LLGLFAVVDGLFVAIFTTVYIIFLRVGASSIGSLRSARMHSWVTPRDSFQTEGPSASVWIPLVALTISAAAYSIGPVGLIYRVCCLPRRQLSSSLHSFIKKKKKKPGRVAVQPDEELIDLIHRSIALHDEFCTKLDGDVSRTRAVRRCEQARRSTSRRPTGCFWDRQIVSSTHLHSSVKPQPCRVISGLTQEDRSEVNRGDQREGGSTNCRLSSDERSRLSSATDG
jgi:hypothetical protein